MITSRYTTFPDCQWDNGSI